MHNPSPPSSIAFTRLDSSQEIALCRTAYTQPDSSDFLALQSSYTTTRAGKDLLVYLRYAFYRERSDGSGIALLSGPERNLLWLTLPSAYPLWPRWDRPYVDIEHPQKGRGGNLSPLSGGEPRYVAGVAAIIESARDRFSPFLE